MATPDFTAGDVMDSAAALLNDVARSVYTYAAQLPYLNLASQELQELFEHNEIPVTTEKSSEITVAADETEITFDVAPLLPEDLIEPQELWEKFDGDTTQFTPMTRVTQLPEYLEGQPTSQRIYWAWNDQKIKLFEATGITIIKIDYIKALFTEIVDENQNIGVINAKTFLEFRTAGLCARYIGENPTRADQLDNSASLAMDRALGIGAKTRQSIITRRRPFRASYKTRGFAF